MCACFFLLQFWIIDESRQWKFFRKEKSTAMLLLVKMQKTMKANGEDMANHCYYFESSWKLAFCHFPIRESANYIWICWQFYHVKCETVHEIVFSSPLNVNLEDFDIETLLMISIEILMKMRFSLQIVKVQNLKNNSIMIIFYELLSNSIIFYELFSLSLSLLYLSLKFRDQFL